jgi:hypothetical protein
LVSVGGITGFSSLADGYLRLDPSGRGFLIIFRQLISLNKENLFKIS